MSHILNVFKPVFSLGLILFVLWLFVLLLHRFSDRRQARRIARAIQQQQRDMAIEHAVRRAEVNAKIQAGARLTQISGGQR